MPTHWQYAVVICTHINDTPAFPAVDAQSSSFIAYARCRGGTYDVQCGAIKTLLALLCTIETTPTAAFAYCTRARAYLTDIYVVVCINCVHSLVLCGGHVMCKRVLWPCAATKSHPMGDCVWFKTKSLHPTRFGSTNKLWQCCIGYLTCKLNTVAVFILQ